MRNLKEFLSVILISGTFCSVNSQVPYQLKQEQTGLIQKEAPAIFTEIPVYPVKNIQNFNFPAQLHSPVEITANDVLASKTGNEVLFPGENMVFSASTYSKNVTFSPPSYTLAPECYSAIERAPDWLKMDLLRQFRLLHKYGYDDDYAIIINTCNPDICDEVAFTIANMPVESLKDSRFRSDKYVIVRNAQFIYDMVDSLQYVQLVEYGNFNTGDYYTTTKYRLKNGKTSTDTIWVEIPREIYYWYVVHPKLQHEGVYVQDNTSASEQRTYGYFWKEYLWYNPDKTHDYTQVNKTTSVGTVKTIPRFGEIIQTAKVLWDRDKGFFYFNRSFTSQDHALNIIGNWASKCVPVDAVLPRAVQPNQIAFEHDGNCGEDTYLLTAACRTALIPVIFMGTGGEDHVWAGIWDQDRWNHYEFFRGGLANSGWGFTSFFEGGTYEQNSWVISYVAGFRPDNYPFSQTSYYTPTATLNLFIGDKNGKPADGAEVTLWCKPGPYYNTGWQKTTTVYTDHSGQLSIPIGDGKQYGFQVYHPDFGRDPVSETTLYTLITSNAIKNKTYNFSHKVDSNAMPSEILVNSSGYCPADANYGIHISFNANEIVTATADEDVQKGRFHYRQPVSGGVSFLLIDSANYEKFLKNQPVDAYHYQPYFGSCNMFLPLPHEGKWYIVLSNKLNSENYQDVNATFELVQNAQKAAISELPNSAIQVFPNPFSDVCYFNTPTNTTEINIIDLFGQVVEKIPGNTNMWSPGNHIPSGTYILKFIGKEGISTQKVLFNK